MKDLRIGDRLRLADASYGSVFMFSHRVRVGMFPFVTLHTTNASISVSHLHYLFSDKGLIVAGSVRVGDYLERSDGYVRVVAREDGFLEGLFNPHTETGEMVVDGFRVSCYTRHVEPRVAQALLAPLRAGFLLLGFDVSFGAFENGHGGVDLGLLAG